MSPARPHLHLARQQADLAEAQRRVRDQQRATALQLAAVGKDDVEIAEAMQLRLQAVRDLLRPVLRRRTDANA